MLVIAGTVAFFGLVWWRMKPWRGSEYREPWREKHVRLDVKPIPVYIVKNPTD